MKKRKSFKEQQKSFWADFKSFMLRGNVLDLAVGVIIGGAFNAIVTALVNILLSVCTWTVPGGLKGLVTVLPAVNETQAGMEGIGQQFAANNLQALATAQATATYGADVIRENPNLIESVKTTILSKYTLHGTTYFYNGSALIDWGAFINAIVSFLIIGFTLFIIVRTAKVLAEKNKELKEKALAELKRAEETKEEVSTETAPAVAAPVVPTNIDVLIEIRDELKKLNDKGTAKLD